MPFFINRNAVLALEASLGQVRKARFLEHAGSRGGSIDLFHREVDRTKNGLRIVLQGK